MSGCRNWIWLKLHVLQKNYHLTQREVHDVKNFNLCTKITLNVGSCYLTEHLPKYQAKWRLRVQDLPLTWHWCNALETYTTVSSTQKHRTWTYNTLTGPLCVSWLHNITVRILPDTGRPSEMQETSRSSVGLVTAGVAAASGDSALFGCSYKYLYIYIYIFIMKLYTKYIHAYRLHTHI